jgi:hypothetical protein
LIISEEHDKRIAENYVFDEVLGRHVSRNEYEQRAKFMMKNKNKLRSAPRNQRQVKFIVSQVV